MLHEALYLGITDAPFEVHRAKDDLIGIRARSREFPVRDSETQEFAGRVLEASHHGSIRRQDSALDP